MKNFFNIIKQNDPANFNFFYALKAIFAVILSAFVANLFYGFSGLIWSSAVAVGVFFLTNIKGEMKDEIFAFASYIGTSIIFIFFMDRFRDLGLYLFIPTFFWLFFISFCACFNKNLSLALIQTTFGGFFLLIAIKYGSDKTPVMMGFLIGGGIASFLRVISFTPYKKFTKKVFNVILDDLINLNLNLFDKKFGKFQQQCLIHINKTKNIFSLKSSKIKDYNLIKNYSRDLFYLYKCEEILHLLSAIKIKKVKDKIFIKELQDEISLNLNNLKMLFLNKKVFVKNDVYLKFKEKNDEILPCLEILYNSFELFILGGERKIDFKKRSKNYIFQCIKNSFNISNLLFRYSLKFAISVCLGVFIALYFNIDHGFWIALGVMTVMRFNIDDVKNATKDTIFATLIGILIAMTFILLFGVSYIFYIIGFILLFLVFYIKSLNFFIWMTSFVILLTMYFAVVSSNYESLMLLRLKDMAIGFVISITISSLFWTHRLKDDIKPLINKMLIDFSTLLESIYYKNSDNFNATQSLFLLNLKDYKNAIKDLKSTIFADILNDFKYMNELILNLKTYLQKNSLDNEFVNSDLAIIKSRFDMLKNLNNDYCFSDFINNDTKLLLLMKEITQSQETIYKRLEEIENTKIW